jgi:hypothetical protein
VAARPIWKRAVREKTTVAVTAERLVEDGTLTVAPELPAPAGGSDYPLVLVEWHDAWFDADQSGPEDCRHDYVVRTVGFLVADGPRFLSIAHEVLPDDDGFRAVTHIPIAIVEAVTYLSPKPQRDASALL